MNYWLNDGGSENVVKNVIRKITPSEAVGFVVGCLGVFQLVEKINPDVVFIPERGAGPVDWALQQFEDSYSGVSRYKVYLPIGTCIDPDTSEEWGPTRDAKRTMVGETVENLYDRGRGPRKPLLIDEVQSGATLTYVTHNLNRAIAEHSVGVGIIENLHVIAVQDTRNSWLSRKHAKGYRSIVESRRKGVKAYVVEMPLFTTDRQVLLNRLFNSPDEYRLPMVEHNIDAQKFIRGLVLTVIGLQNYIGSFDQEVVNWGEKVIEIAEKV